MKKLLIVFAAGAFLTSCSSGQDTEAAAEFCDCVSLSDAAESTSLMEILESTEKRKACLVDWQEKYDGKITEGFGDVLKESCPDGHAQAEEMGMFD